MSTEELAEEQAGRPLQFDAHEFDGLRDALEKEAEGIIGKVDEFIRANPWTCIAIAAAAGIALSCMVRRSGRDATEELLRAAEEIVKAEA
jgi:ElaB/YqjD/DUF883 family membrane-anchored ribosome-binding protein